MENQEENKYLGEAKISKLLLKFSIPCILSLLISSLYNIVDQIFIGNSELGYLGNAATTVVFPITIISVAFAWCFGDGSAAFLSLCQGRKDTKNAHKAVGNSILITFIVSILFVILGFLCMDKVLYLFGASDASIGLARDYFKIILSAIPIYMLTNMMTAVIRADGSPAFSMASTLAGAIINIILDPVFIFIFKLGIEGAAWATIIGQIISFIIALVYYFRTKTFKLCFDSFKLDMKLFSNVIKLGVSTFITQMSIVIISLVCNIMLAKYGTMSKYGADIPIAVIGICMKVFTIVINIIVGIILGAQPILGYNFGAKKYDRVKGTFKTVLFATIIVGIISTMIFEICPQVVIRIFGTESDLYMEFATITFRVFLMFVTFTCIIKMTSIFFQSVGQPLKAAIISLSRDIVCFVPLVIILPHFIGITGALWAAPIADVIGIVITSGLVMHFFKNLGKNLVSSKEKENTIADSIEGAIITIAREHGSQGKYVGKLVAEKLNIPYYYKEMTAIAAQESGLDKEFVDKLHSNTDPLYDLYMTTSPVKYAIEAQEKVIKEIAKKGTCVIVGRAADYVLRENKNLVRVFIYAPKDYRISKVMEMYHDTKQKASKNIEKSDKARAGYYKIISGKDWGKTQNYDLCINSSIGTEKTAEIICEYVKNLNQ
ncbi:MAG: MATE family efflux transporter [Clostridia bacterium]|nr:MATE family efflux transporter [Clostridia bacterium]